MTAIFSELVDCPACGHTGPDTCFHCGGKKGTGEIKPCLSCINRGPTPITVSSPEKTMIQEPS